MIDRRPESPTSPGGASRVAPSSSARAAAASALSTATYEFHVGGAPASRSMGGCGTIEATSFPSRRIIEKWAPSPIGRSSASQPNRLP